MRRSAARAACAAFVLLSFAFAAPAAATTLVLPDGTSNPQPYQSWVDRALVPTPPGSVTLSLARCPGGYDWASGCADAAARTMYLSGLARDSRSLLHELGHIFDATVMSDQWRGQFQSIVRRPGPWVADATLGPPNEWFAEGYSLCARHRTLRQRYLGGNYDYAPTPRQHAAVCALIRQAAGSSSA